MKITEEAPIEVSVHRSTVDGALVVEIDTTDETGEIRVSINDGLIWEGDPDSTTSARELLTQIDRLRFAAGSRRLLDATPEQNVIADVAFRQRVEKILHDAAVDGWWQS